MAAGSSDQDRFDAAHALWRQGRISEAVRLLDDLTHHHPDNAGLHSALGVCRFESGDFGAARQALERALALDPAQGVAAYNLAHLLLLQGDEERGLALYERRWDSFNRPAWHPPAELSWDGEAFDGTLLVLAEQGFGDMIQFARFLPLAAKRCRRLVLVVPPELKRLLSFVPGVAQVVTTGEPLPSFDRFVMLMSLAYRMRTFGPKRPCPPYLAASSAKALPRSGFKIGLVWSGRVDDRHQKARALSLSQLAPFVANTADACFYSLQLGASGGEAADWPGPEPLADLSAGMTDFEDTAALLAQIDLLICVDTAIAHLTGALGRPAFVLLPARAHWVWGLDDACSWYPSLRLFRADAQGWERALTKLSEALSERVDSAAVRGYSPRN